MYINEALEHGKEENSIVTELLDNVENKHNLPNATANDLTALTLQLKKFNKSINKKKVDQKYKCEDIHRVNLPLHAVELRQLPPYQLLEYLEKIWKVSS